MHLRLFYLYQCFFSLFSIFILFYAEKIYIAYLGKKKKKTNVFSLRSFIKKFHKQGYWKMLDETHL